MLIDSHCHLHDREFFGEKQAEEMIERTHKNNIKKIICIGTSIKDSLEAQEFASKHDGIYWTFGIHPGEARLTDETYFLKCLKIQFPQTKK